jgi:hypothetical protein
MTVVSLIGKVGPPEPAAAEVLVALSIIVAGVLPGAITAALRSVLGHRKRDIAKPS